MEVCDSKGRMMGSTFATSSVNLAITGDYDAVFRKYPYAVQACIDQIDNQIDVDTYFSLNRIPRRLALMRFNWTGLGTEIQEDMNIWMTAEKAKNKRLRYNMRQHIKPVLSTHISANILRTYFWELVCPHKNIARIRCSWQKGWKVPHSFWGAHTHDFSQAWLLTAY